MARENRNELMVVEPINFNELNVSIEALGENRALSDKEKEIGVNLLKEWEENVIHKLENKKYEMQKVETFFTGRNEYSVDDALREKMAKFAGTEKLFQAYKAMQQAVSEFDLKRPQRPNLDPNRTIAENDSDFGEYELELTKFNIEKSKVEYNKKKTYNKWFSATRKSPSVKKLLAGISDYVTKMDKYKTECKDKAHLARINIAISDEKIRDAIREIVEFTKKIR